MILNRGDGAHHCGLVFQANKCCCVLGCAKARHPEAATKFKPSVQRKPLVCRDKCSLPSVSRECRAAPLTVSLEQLKPSVRTMYKSAFLGSFLHWHDSQLGGLTTDATTGTTESHAL